LSLFIVVNTALLVSLRYATVFENPYVSVISTTEVLLTELIKFVCSFLLCFIFDANLSFDTLGKLLWNVASEDSGDIVKLTIPAALYIVQNNLQYIIETRMLFLVMYQFKLISTALFYSNLLSRRVHNREWLAIFALCAGVCVVEVSQPDIEGSHYHAGPFVGTLSVLTAIITSGFAGVYFEKILKTSAYSM
jgi:UDP-sugar transporter A1/2/3